MQASESQMQTQMEVIQAGSKDELYRKLFEQYGKYQYHIIDEKARRKFPFFWKKEYEIKVMVLRLEDKPEQESSAPAASTQELDIKPVKDTGIKRIMEDLETRTTELPPKQRSASFDPARAAARKKELLQLLKISFSMYEKQEKKPSLPAKQAIQKMTERKETSVFSKDIEELKAAIAKIHEQSDAVQLEKAIPEVVQRVFELLKENDVDERFIQLYTKSLQEKLKDIHLLTEEEVRSLLLDEMAAQFKTASKLDEDENKVIVLFGPTGVGKTTTISKLGWQFYKRKRSVGFITTDVFRSGAIQQLQGYADLMDSELRVAAGREELEEAILYFRNVKKVDHILVDTAGRNYMDDDAVEEVQEYMDIIKPDIACLTFSASMRKKDVLTVLARFQQVQANCLVVTKLDETESIGDWLSVSSSSDVPILFVTNGQNITKHIHVPTGEWLAERVLSKDIPLEGEIFDLRTDEE